MIPHGTFCWNELRSWDAEKAKRFYADCLGWTFERMDDSYTICMSGGRRVAGIFQLPSGAGMDDVPDHWAAFIAVDDLDRCLDSLRRSGGTVRREPFDVPGVGRIALVEDNVGAQIGWMTPVAD